MLTRWDPFREMLSIRDAMDRLFEESFLRPAWLTAGEDTFASMPINLYETDKELVLEATLPGFSPEEVDIEVQNNTVVIRAEHTEEREEKERDYHIRERRYGKFYRQVALPVEVNADKAQAEFKNGVVVVHFPKAEQAKPRKIKIKK